ncbi:MAG TPA: hypothetical protein VF735_00120 [Pyrinomonadaceae bacterium]
MTPFLLLFLELSRETFVPQPAPRLTRARACIEALADDKTDDLLSGDGRINMRPDRSNCQIGLAAAGRISSFPMPLSTWAMKGKATYAAPHVSARFTDSETFICLH